MINQFLATLDNDPTTPGLPTASSILWPSFSPRIITGVEADLRNVFIGANATRLVRFTRAVQLTNLVQESPFQDVITAGDPRVTYSKTALRKFFGQQGYVVTSTSGVNLVFSALPGTPTIGRWFLTLLGAAGGTATMQVVNDRGESAEVVFLYSSDHSELVTFPWQDGAFTLYGVITAGMTWDVVYQRTGVPWVQTCLTQLETVDPSGFLSPRLLNAFQAAPLALDRLAAVVAGLGGGK